MQDLNKLATFAAVVEAHSFSRAAEKLGVSKALVSRQISDLETALGCKLLKRTTRSLGLTTAGALLHQRATQVIDYAEAAYREVEEISTQTATGAIRVYGGSGFGPRHLVQAATRFMARHPSIRLDMEINEKIVDLVTDNVDVAVRTADAGPRLDSMVARRLAPLRRVFCAAPEYLRKHRAPRNPLELVEYNCLAFGGDAKTGWVVHGPAGTMNVRISGSFTTNNSEVLHQAALRGLGIALVPTFAVYEDLKSARLIRVLPEYAGPERVLYALHLPDRNLPQRVRLFVRFLEDYFGPEPYWDEGLNITPAPQSSR